MWYWRSARKTGKTYVTCSPLQQLCWLGFLCLGGAVSCITLTANWMAVRFAALCARQLVAGPDAATGAAAPYRPNDHCGRTKLASFVESEDSPGGAGGAIS